MFAKFKANQLRRPHGLFSQFTANQMNRANMEINQKTIQLLEIDPSSRILEVGFGGGDCLNQMSAIVKSGLLVGIDISEEMLKLGRKRFRNEIFQGRMELKEGSSSQIPYPDNSFDKVCTINCIYFWPDPVDDLKEILRVMKDNGKLVISVYKKEKMQELPQTRYGFRLYSGNQFQDLFTQAGFKNSTIVNANLKLGEATFVIGIKK